MWQTGYNVVIFSPMGVIGSLINESESGTWDNISLTRAVIFNQINELNEKNPTQRTIGSQIRYYSFSYKTCQTNAEIFSELWLGYLSVLHTKQSYSFRRLGILCMSNMDRFYDTAFAPFVHHLSFAFHGRKTNTHVGTNIGESKQQQNCNLFFWGGGGGGVNSL